MAKALLVMSGETRAGFIVGGEYGQGAFRTGGKTQGDYNLVAGSYGYTIGEEQMDIIIAFMTEEALNEFKSVDGWKVGGGKRFDTTSLKDSVAAFFWHPGPPG